MAQAALPVLNSSRNMFFTAAVSFDEVQAYSARQVGCYRGFFAAMFRRPVTIRSLAILDVASWPLSAPKVSAGSWRSMPLV